MRTSASMITTCFVAWLAAAVTGCDNESLPSTSVDSPLVVDLRERLLPSGRTIAMEVKTEKQYQCANYALLYHRFSFGNHFSFDFGAISDEDYCLNGLAPASASIDLGRLPTDIYSLELNTSLSRNRGRLEVTDTDIKMEFASPRGIKIVRTALKRVPSNTYWGYILYEKYESPSKADSLLEKLESLGAVFQKQAPGDYRYYRISAEGEIERPEGDKRWLRYIIFQFNGDPVALQEWIWFAERFNREFYFVELQSDRGQIINNSF